MPDREDGAVQLLCRRLGVADETALPVYARGRMERELLPMLRSALIQAGDPCVYAVVESIVLATESIAAAQRMDGAASAFRSAAGTALEAARAWAENRHRETTILDARQARLDEREARLDARQAAQDEREDALDARQAEQDRRQAALDAERRALDRRQEALDAQAAQIAAAAAESCRPLLARWFGGGRASASVGQKRRNQQ